MRSFAIVLTGALLLLSGACGDGTGPDEASVASVAIRPPAQTLVLLQDTVRLSAEVRDRSGGIVSGVRVEWSSLDPTVVTVDSLGRAVSRGLGTARIRAAVAGVADTAEVEVVGGVATPAMNFVRLAAGAPGPVALDTSFWAVKGDGRELEIRHRSGDGEDDDGDRLLEFRVPGDALLRRPDGTAFARGDSVRIHLRVDPEGRFLFDLEPSGLQFDPDHPAELRIHYRLADAESQRREDSIFVWRREQPTAPWIRIATARLKDDDEVRAEITGFSAFSLAIP